jgi:hypothetical protein
MKRIAVLLFMSALAGYCFSQAADVALRGLSAEENLKAINGLGPYSVGGIGFDTRYEGVKGTPRLTDTLLPSFIRLKGQDFYIELLSDIDLVQNSVLYLHPKTKKMFSIPADMVSELIIKTDDKELLFRTTGGRTFEKEMKPERFCQILKDGNYQFIRIPGKQFVQADYKGAYSADRRYDEYVPVSKYYILCQDSVFHQLQLSKKSLAKLYPDKKQIINSSPGEENFGSKEEMVISIISGF